MYGGQQQFYCNVCTIFIVTFTISGTGGKAILVISCTGFRILVPQFQLWLLKKKIVFNYYFRICIIVLNSCISDAM